jgi:hypothetical protein
MADLDTFGLSVSLGRSYPANAFIGKWETPVAGLAIGHLQGEIDRDRFAKNDRIVLRSLGNVYVAST